MKKIFYCITFCLSFNGFSQISSAEIDNLVAKTMTAFDVPGIAVSVIKDGKIIHEKGYGVKSIITKEKVNEHTLFGIASNSKAFTSAALAILVDQKKLNWDDKVVQYLPEFKMYNDYVTQEFTIRDLLTHKSGLGLGAGDLMIWPDGSDFKADDIIKNIQFLKPVSGFRTKYDYDNLLYIIAGEVIHKASGLTWNEFVEQHFFDPLQMKNSGSTWNRVRDTSNVIVPHVPIDGKLKAISRYKNQTFDAAAGIYSSVHDLSNWLIMQINKGKFQDKIIFSEKQHNEMWTPQTLMANRTSPPYNSLFKAYGLGWQLTDVKGKLQVSHTGGLEGIVTQTIMIPEINLGIIVLTNQQSGAAFMAISNTIKDSYLGIEPIDHVAQFSARMQSNTEKADKITTDVWQTVEKNKKSKIDLKKYVGTYRDNWLGEVTISLEKGKLIFASKRSPQLKGEMFFHKENSFVVKWFNRYFHADAHVFFNENNSGFTMLPISPETDFSYDFQDLDFVKVK